MKDPDFLFNQRYNPESKRLKYYDYSSDGWYFITICTFERINYFWEIFNWKIILNEYWKIVKEEILNTEKIRSNVIIDEFIVMPNHIHLVLIINNLNNNDVNLDISNNFKPYKNKFWPQKNNLASIIRWLKSSITKNINKLWIEPYFAWQKSYHDKIIRKDEDLIKSRKYIIENPLKWENDINNPKNITNKNK